MSYCGLKVDQNHGQLAVAVAVVEGCDSKREISEAGEFALLAGSSGTESEMIG